MTWHRIPHLYLTIIRSGTYKWFKADCGCYILIPTIDNVYDHFLVCETKKLSRHFKRQFLKEAREVEDQLYYSLSLPLTITTGKG